CLIMTRRPLLCTLFPYTTLFRSLPVVNIDDLGGVELFVQIVQELVEGVMVKVDLELVLRQLLQLAPNLADSPLDGLIVLQIDTEGDCVAASLTLSTVARALNLSIEAVGISLDLHLDSAKLLL